MTKVTFKEVEREIVSGVNALIGRNVISDPGGFDILDGFVSPPVQSDIGDTLSLAGKTYPIVAVAGRSTGVVHFLTVKSLVSKETWEKMSK